MFNSLVVHTIARIHSVVSVPLPHEIFFLRTDDRFPALCLLVKHWAINADCNNSMDGTFNRLSMKTFLLCSMTESSNKRNAKKWDFKSFELNLVTEREERLGDDN